jgi:aconitate hydratase
VTGVQTCALPISQGDTLSIPAGKIAPGKSVDVLVNGKAKVAVTNDLTAQELTIIQSGGLLNTVRPA